MRVLQLGYTIAVIFACRVGATLHTVLNMGDVVHCRHSCEYHGRFLLTAKYRNEISVDLYLRDCLRTSCQVDAITPIYGEGRDPILLRQQRETINDGKDHLIQEVDISVRSTRGLLMLLAPFAACNSGEICIQPITSRVSWNP